MELRTPDELSFLQNSSKHEQEKLSLLIEAIAQELSEKWGRGIKSIVFKSEGFSTTDWEKLEPEVKRRLGEKGWDIAFASGEEDWCSFLIQPKEQQRAFIFDSLRKIYSSRLISGLF